MGKRSEKTVQGLEEKRDWIVSVNVLLYIEKFWWDLKLSEHINWYSCTLSH